MKVSIVTPTLVVDKVLMDARSSVARQAQRIEIDHFIVIDDRDAILPPDEKNGNVATHFLHNGHEKGPGGARNTGLDHADGEFVFFLDADDVWCDNYVEEVLAIFTDKPNVHCVSVAGLSFGESIARPKLNIPVLSDGLIPRTCVAWNPVGCPSGFSYRRDGKTRTLRFKDAIYFQDLIFYLELLSIGAVFWRHRRMFFWYRKSQGQLTSIVSPAKVGASQALVHRCLEEWRLAGLSSWEARVASVQIKRLSAARLRHRDHLNTLLLCALAPAWALGQMRRLLGNIRIGRQAIQQDPAMARSIPIHP